MNKSLSSKEQRIHALRCWLEYFSAVLDGSKTFEIRDNDRDYQVGDVLLLKEWKPDRTPGMTGGKYTGRRLSKRVTYVTDFAQRADYVVLGLDRGDVDTPAHIPANVRRWLEEYAGQQERLGRSLETPQDRYAGLMNVDRADEVRQYLANNGSPDRLWLTDAECDRVIANLDEWHGLTRDSVRDWERAIDDARISPTTDAPLGDEDGPGEEDGPWAAGWAERSGNAELCVLCGGVRAKPWCQTPCPSAKTSGDAP